MTLTAPRLLERNPTAAIVATSVTMSNTIVYIGESDHKPYYFNQGVRNGFNNNFK